MSKELVFSVDFLLCGSNNSALAYHARQGFHNMKPFIEHDLDSGNCRRVPNILTKSHTLKSPTTHPLHLSGFMFAVSAILPAQA